MLTMICTRTNIKSNKNKPAKTSTVQNGCLGKDEELMGKTYEEELINMAKEHLLYGDKLYPVIIDHCDGNYLYDMSGKAYLDFVAGIAVNSIGYHNPIYLDALKKQMEKGIHYSGYFYNEPACKAAQILCERSGMSKVFFGNSGTEAVEGALKVAKKYGAMKKSIDNNDYEIIAMKHSFHGRSLGSLAMTNNDKYQGPFVPGNVKAVWAEFNNLEDVRSKVTDKTCGILCEVLQGEGGIVKADPEFLKGLRELCDEKDIILIFDEVQCGMGRLGSLFAHDLYGVKPDVLTMAKALGGGVPVGAFLVNEKCKDVLQPGEHGNTYGANPLCMAAVCAVFEIYDKLDLVGNVNKVAPVLKEGILDMCKKHPKTATGHRGMGLMQGIVVTVDREAFERKAFDKGLLVCMAGADVIRFVPPLTITEDEIHKAMDIIDEILTEFEAEA